LPGPPDETAANESDHGPPAFSLTAASPRGWNQRLEGCRAVPGHRALQGREPGPDLRRLREQGRTLPDGLCYLDSWVEPTSTAGFQLMECDDAVVLKRWVLQWRRPRQLRDRTGQPSKAVREFSSKPRNTRKNTRNQSRSVLPSGSYSRPDSSWFSRSFFFRVFRVFPWFSS